MNRALRRAGEERPADLHVFGAGPRNAARALEGFSPRPLLHVGFAGGLRPDALPGTRFVVRRALDAKGTIDISAGAFAQAAVARGARPAVIRTVSAPLDAAMKARLAAEGGVDLVDMETAVIARAAADLGFDYFGLRIVSDGLLDEIPACVTQSWDGDRFRTSAIVRGLFRRPDTLPRLLALGRKARALSKDIDREVRAILQDTRK